MNLKAVVLALGLSLAQGAVLAAPVFVDDFSDSATAIFDTANDSTAVFGTAVTLTSAPTIQRRISVSRISGTADSSLSRPTVAVEGGEFVAVQAGNNVSTFGIHYSGAGLNVLPNPFAAGVTFQLVGNDQAPVTINLSATSSSVVISSTTAGGGYPLTVSLGGIGDFGGGDSDDTDGFSVIFQSNNQAFDFSIDNLALVPAPATLAMLGIGFLALAGIGRRKFGS